MTVYAGPGEPTPRSDLTSRPNRTVSETAEKIEALRWCHPQWPRTEQIAALLSRGEEMENHVRLLLPLAKGYVAAHPNVESTQRIIKDAEAAVTPPGALTPQGEYERALWLASKILDRPYGDPDDDLALLSRQFLRLSEKHAARKS